MLLPNLNINIEISQIVKLTTQVFIAWVLCFSSYGQCADNLLNKVKETDTIHLPAKEKINRWYYLLEKANQCNVPRDSVYAKIIYSISKLEIEVNNNYNKSNDLAFQALRLNLTANAGSSKTDAAKNALQLAVNYENSGLSKKALLYFDTCQMVAERDPVQPAYILYSKLRRAYLYFLTGDYQKSVEESYTGEQYSILQNDESYTVEFLNLKAQSLFFQNQISAANKSLDTVIKSASLNKYTFELQVPAKQKQ